MKHADAGLARLLPHRPPMVLVDGVEHADAERCVARWTVPARSPWVEDGRLARAAFVEIAAQAAALHAGLAMSDSGAPPRLGYLGALSGFRVHGDAHPGDVLRATAVPTARFGLMSRVECRVERLEEGGTTLLAEGALTVALEGPSGG
jgi:predicted hotdog family 3-hydroxylacyl-ACP dehydratase